MHTPAEQANLDTSIPPSPADTGEALRWEEGRRRRRLLEGTWRSDLEREMERRIGTTRRQAWGHPAMATAPFSSVIRALAVLYDTPTVVRHDSDGIDGLVQSIRLSGLWGLMARVQRYTLGLRECFVRVHVGANGRPVYRPVYPDMVLARAGVDAPDMPVHVEELRLRVHPTTGRQLWTLDVLSVEDPDAPYYRVVEAKAGLEHGEDLTALFLGEDLSGASYPYRRKDSRPVVPYVLYHAERTGDRLFDPYVWSELVEGSYALAVKMNFADHTFMQASWPQRWALGCKVASVEIEEEGKKGTRRAVVVDPAMLLELEAIEGQGQAQVGQFNPAGDITQMEEVISSQMARLAQDAGVPASDIQRMNSQRSGVSISLSNEGKRAQQRRYAGQFRDSDERLVALTAALINRATGSNYPEGGYSIIYPEIPLSPDEQTARREHVLELMAAGLMSPIKAYMSLNPGVTETQAQQDLAAIAQARAALAIGGART